MNEEQSPDQVPEHPNLPSQAEVYDSLRRIGELEDQKQAIQDEIESRTDRLREAIKSVDAGSLLYKILSSALADSKAAAPRPSSTPKKSRGTAKKARKGGRKR